MLVFDMKNVANRILNIENNLFLMFSKSCKSSNLYQHCFVSNIVSEYGNLSNRISEISYSTPLYINKEELDLLI